MSKQMHRRGLGDRGAVLVITALSMFVLIGFLGLAIDVGKIYHDRRIMQTAADSGALSGAAEILRGHSSLIESSAQTATASNGFTHGSDNIIVTVNNPPASGFYAGNSQFAEVLIAQPAQTYFMGLFGVSPQIPARAVAGLVGGNQNCVYALESTGTGIHLQSSALLTANCGFNINSTNKCALDLDSSAQMTATEISISGNYCKDGGTTIDPAPTIGVPPVTDPLAHLEPPPVTGTTEIPIRRTSRLEISSNTTLLPGVYRGGILIKSSAKVTVQPGIYVLEGGGMMVEGGISGSGVMFYNTKNASNPYQPILFKNSYAADLSAPTSGPYAGVLFFQDRTASSDVNFENGHGDGFILETDASTKLDGMLYFQTQRVRLKNKSTPIIRNLLVARSIVVESSSNLQMDFAGASPGGGPIKRLCLVE